jgi:hypothetical protein
MTEHTSKPQENEGKAGIIVLTIIALSIAIFMDFFELQAYMITVLILAFVGAAVGKERRIGYNNGFYAAYFLGIIGLIIVFASKRLDDQSAILVGKLPNSNADELLKFYELKEKGVITEEEFQQQKSKLM